MVKSSKEYEKFMELKDYMVNKLYVNHIIGNNEILEFDEELRKFCDKEILKYRISFKNRVKKVIHNVLVSLARFVE